MILGQNETQTLSPRFLGLDRCFTQVGVPSPLRIDDDAVSIVDSRTSHDEALMNCRGANEMKASTTDFAIDLDFEMASDLANETCSYSVRRDEHFMHDAGL